ncbi:hypothetical protein GGS26DRAFT_588711 [Hypomontagnella submonticulosa]|nr:hypothetical protein GGS26DRAFT_588711 [Hypomontagnella submonticulosa]
MRFFLSAIPFAACALAAVLAEPAEPINLTERDAALDELAPRDNGFKINYYTDGGCTDYLVSIFPFTDDSCYGYQFTGDNSANIANCDAPSGSDCVCTFFVQDNCQGAGQSIGYSSGADCTSNFGRGFLSMRCTYL